MPLLFLVWQNFLHDFLVNGHSSAAGADTVCHLPAYSILIVTRFSKVACTVGSFFLAAATNPVARRKAQAEIDRVVGRNRLPRFDDRPSLPFVEAFYREVMRWRPAMPMGVAHTTTEDNVYEGYFIPKGNRIFSM